MFDEPFGYLERHLTQLQVNMSRNVHLDLSLAYDLVQSVSFLQRHLSRLQKSVASLTPQLSRSRPFVYAPQFRYKEINLTVLRSCNQLLGRLSKVRPAARRTTGDVVVVFCLSANRVVCAHVPAPSSRRLPQRARSGTLDN